MATLTIKGLHILVLLWMCSPALAQSPPAIQWQRALGGSLFEAAKSIERTSDGGYIVGARSDSNNGDVTGNNGQVDCWVIKLDALGGIQWQRSLGGSGIEECNSIQETGDGGYIFTSSTSSSNGDVSGAHGLSDAWVVRLDISGDIIWQRALGGTGQDYGASVRQTANGGFIFAGSTVSNDGDISGNHGNVDYWVVKLDPSGTIEWQKSLGGSASESALSIRQTGDGGYVVGGQSSSNDGDVSGNHGAGDYWVVKLDGDGDIQWQRTLGGSGEETAWGLDVTSDGGSVMAGWTHSNDGDVSGNHGGADFWVVKLDPSGAVQWQKALGGSAEEVCHTVRGTFDNGCVVAGSATSVDGDVTGVHAPPGRDAWVVELDGTGAINWQKALGGVSPNDFAMAIVQAADSGYVVAGSTGSNDGDVSGNHGWQDAWIVKLGDLGTGVDQGGAAMDEQAVLCVRPNPSSGVVYIQCAAVDRDAHITITDVLGREVTRWNPGTGHAMLDLGDQPRGVYVITVRSAQGSQSRRLILE